MKSLSPINILIIIGLIVLVYLGYDKYINKNIGEILEQNAVIIKENTESERIDQKKNNEIAQSRKLQTKSVISSQSSESSFKPVSNQSAEPSIPIKLTTKNGLYQNKTYNYQIICPPDWPLRVRSESNVSIGIVPPKNGQGAITIEVSAEQSNEIKKVKTEAKRYSGMIDIKEEPIILAGVNGTKLILKNVVLNTTNIYIILEKYNFYYIIKYTEESVGFVNQAQTAIETLQFTK